MRNYHPPHPKKKAIFYILNSWVEKKSWVGSCFCFLEVIWSIVISFFSLCQQTTYVVLELWSFPKERGHSCLTLKYKTILRLTNCKELGKLQGGKKSQGESNSTVEWVPALHRADSGTPYGPLSPIGSQSQIPNRGSLLAGVQRSPFHCLSTLTYPSVKIRKVNSSSEP